MKHTKIAIAQMDSRVGDFDYNIQQIEKFAQKASQAGADILLTPELSLVGYSPEDWLLRQDFYEKAEHALADLMQKLQDYSLYVLVGHPIKKDGSFYNATSLLYQGKIIAQYYKQALPNYSVFDEKRYFTAGNEVMVFVLQDIHFGVVICEDVWDKAVVEKNKIKGVDVLLILNASPFERNKQALRHQVVREHVSCHHITAFYVNRVGGQDELVFDGNSFILDQSGELVLQLAHCKSELAIIELKGKRPIINDKTEVYSFNDDQEINYFNQSELDFYQQKNIEEEIYQVLVLGVRDYVLKNKFTGVILGLSGGVDSALTLAIAVDALGADSVWAVMMPSPYTLEISCQDAKSLAHNLGVRYDEISIDEGMKIMDGLLLPFLQHKKNHTQENIQARLRGMILMALSNQFDYLVLTTGNKSELATGYCTLYGDMAGGFGVLKDVTKTWVYRLCQWRNQVSAIIPERILTRPPSAELRPNQVDQETLPPYAILDAVIEKYMEQNCSAAEIIKMGVAESQLVEKIIRLIHQNEYKRKQAPIGIRVTSCAFGRDWRYPMTARLGK